jgi:protein ImuA
MGNMPESHAFPAVEISPGVTLARRRAHEVTGPSRLVFALATAARLSGPVLWIQPNWSPERLMGDGVMSWVEPNRLVIARARTLIDILWTTEEALRSGAVPLVVAQLPALPTLTATRRLHLAAEAGADRGPGAPLALLLTPEPGGVPGIETRWRLAPAPGWAIDEEPRWRLTRLRARMAPEQTWEMAARGNRLRMVRPKVRPPAPATAAPPAPAAPQECRP